jgi:thiol-disulfide isomerase/thioredoxin
MFRPSFATLLSLTLAFSLMPGVFSATARAERPESLFDALSKPVELPGIIVEDLSERKTALAEIIRTKSGHGRVILHLWATFCPPCLEEIRQLSGLQQTLSRKGIQVIVIAQEPDGLITVPAFQRRHGIALQNVFIDRTGTIAGKLGGQGLPASFLLNGDGRLGARHTGPLDWSLLVEAP